MYCTLAQWINKNIKNYLLWCEMGNFLNFISDVIETVKYFYKYLLGKLGCCMGYAELKGEKFLHCQGVPVGCLSGPPPVCGHSALWSSECVLPSGGSPYHCAPGAVAVQSSRPGSTWRLHQPAQGTAGFNTWYGEETVQQSSHILYLLLSFWMAKFS